MTHSQVFELDVTFQTARPLSQQTGSLMWRMASHFRSIGPSTYQLQTIAERSLEVTLPEMLAGLVEQIEGLVSAEQPMWPMRVVSITAKELEHITDKDKP